MRRQMWVAVPLAIVLAAFVSGAHGAEYDIAKAETFINRAGPNLPASVQGTLTLKNPTSGKVRVRLQCSGCGEPCDLCKAGEAWQPVTQPCEQTLSPGGSELTFRCVYATLTANLPPNKLPQAPRFKVIVGVE